MYITISDHPDKYPLIVHSHSIRIYPPSTLLTWDPMGSRELGLGSSSLASDRRASAADPHAAASLASPWSPAKGLMNT